MTVMKQKPLSWILERLRPCRKVVVLGCGTCATVCFAGGEREVEELCCALQLALRGSDAEVQLEGATCKRVCDWEFVEPLVETLRGSDAILSLACGAGTNLLADQLPTTRVIPGVDTTSLAANAGPDSWHEMCAGCGDCILDLTFGVCPVARCAKSLLNGPCGGSKDGKCEVGKDVECAWAKIVERAAALGRLEDLERPIPPKNWSPARDGGPRTLKRADLGLRRLVTEDLDES
ncbi:MAG TPA: methylenetetrahydrofolate reductase C-terminal domain-containing protein [Planctomycetota bacterium]|nr:methylenetetrahydrofolate reductase C-terminal domain-containing protein [Planctomycetota bacterium]